MWFRFTIGLVIVIDSLLQLFPASTSTIRYLGVYGRGTGCGLKGIEARPCFRVFRASMQAREMPESMGLLHMQLTVGSAARPFAGEASTEGFSVRG